VAFWYQLAQVLRHSKGFTLIDHFILHVAQNPWFLTQRIDMLIAFPYTCTGSRYWKQGVKLLSSPVSVGSQDLHSDEYLCVEIDAAFDSSSGNLMVRESFLQ